MMKNSRRKWCVALTGLCLFTSVVQAEPVTTTQAAQALVQSVYQPEHAALAQTTESWLHSVRQFCAVDQVQDVATLQQRFSALVAAFSRVELYRTGPLLEANRQNRFFYWPDKRRVGERQLRGLLAATNLGELTVDAMAKKSVALQGLPALERLLFSRRYAEALGTPDKTAVCHAMLVISDNLHRMASALEAGWGSNTDYVKSFVQPYSESPYFRTEKEVLRNIVTQAVVGLDVILNRKLQPMVNSDSATIRKAPLWLSEQTLVMLRGNLQGMKSLLLGSGLAEGMRLDNELRFEFRTALGLLDKLSQLPTLADGNGHLVGEAHELVTALSAVVEGIAFTVGDRFSSELGVSAGFNSEDGD